MYLKIHSKSENVSINDMFILGVSTARGTDKIGQFGSGSMMSCLLILREMGQSPIIYVNGTKIHFTFEPDFTSEGGQYNRVFMHTDKNTKELSVSLEYGEKDWNDVGMAIREFVSNAIDQGESPLSCIFQASEPAKTDKGVTVYIPMSGAVSKYYQNIGEKFLHYSGRENRKLIVKSEPSPCKLYRRGVFIRELSQKSIFDYNLDFDIAENRNGSSDSMTWKIFAHLSFRLTKENAQILFDHVCKNTDCMEVKWDTYHVVNEKPWKEVFENSPHIFAPNNIEIGEGVRVNPKWFDFITKMCPEKSGILSGAALEGMIPVPANNECLSLFNKLWDFVCMIDPTHGKEKPSIEMFKTKDGQIPKFLGCYMERTRKISIWQDQCMSAQTILEEICHHTSGQMDCTRKFQEYLFRLLSEAFTAY